MKSEERKKKSPQKKQKRNPPKGIPPLRAWAKARVIRSTAAQLRIRLALRFPPKLQMFLGPQFTKEGDAPQASNGTSVERVPRII